MVLLASCRTMCMHASYQLLLLWAERRSRAVRHCCSLHAAPQIRITSYHTHATRKGRDGDTLLISMHLCMQAEFLSCNPSTIDRTSESETKPGDRKWATPNRPRTSQFPAHTSNKHISKWYATQNCVINFKGCYDEEVLAVITWVRRSKVSAWQKFWLIHAAMGWAFDNS